MNKFSAWAIEIIADDGGPYFLTGQLGVSDEARRIPVQLSGHKVALFKSRDSAREFRRKLNKVITIKTKIVRVSVSIEIEASIFKGVENA